MQGEPDELPALRVPDMNIQSRWSDDHLLAQYHPVTQLGCAFCN